MCAYSKGQRVQICLTTNGESQEIMISSPKMQEQNVKGNSVYTVHSKTTWHMMISVLNLQFQKSLSNMFGLLYLKNNVHHLLLKYEIGNIKKFELSLKI